MPALTRALQPRALLKLNLTNHVRRNGDRYCDPTECNSNPARRVRCDKDGYVTSIWREEGEKCLQRGVPSVLPSGWLGYWSSAEGNAVNISSFSPAAIDALLTLNRLQAINIFVKGGVLPTQLAGLAQLKHAIINYNCLTGNLPQEWHFNNLSTLMITGMLSDDTYYFNRPLPLDCGISGTIPLAWPVQLPQLRYLYMPNNRLSGTLHPLYTLWSAMAEVWLQDNKLSGSIPEQYADWGLQKLQLGVNELTGPLPSFAAGDQPTAIQKSLTLLQLFSNKIVGESDPCRCLAHIMCGFGMCFLCCDFICKRAGCPLQVADYVVMILAT